MTASLTRRLREQRSRVLVRSWDYRQRAHARGVWLRLRRVLADAREAYGIPPDEARRLVVEGYPQEPVGQELQPAKLIVFVPARRIAEIRGARSLALGLGAELLGAECLALVRFETDGSSAGP